MRETGQQAFRGVADQRALTRDQGAKRVFARMVDLRSQITARVDDTIDRALLLDLLAAAERAFADYAAKGEL